MVVAMIGIAAHAGAGRIGRSLDTPSVGAWGTGDVAPELPQGPAASVRGGRPSLTLFCCGCAVCRRAVAEINGTFRGGDRVALTGVFHGTAAQAEHFRQETQARFAWVPDPLGQIHARWRVDQCPALFAVSPSGTIAGLEEPRSTEEVASAVTRARRMLAGD